ncbi:MAG TPA: flavodoxin domain-containing protein [Sandaracinaceae bacterium LLY-WYZ-13_1]|nr:flavodoxin domain-containing protein [Sandaracinaceae bacterium LLY-WYZ-13_1]
MKILLICGSEMGNAEMVADLVKDAIEEHGHEAELMLDAELEELGLEDRDLLLVVTSTTGLGDVPQNLEPVYDALVARRPDLSHLRYGIVGMGDRNYKDTFCGGPKKMDAILSELGATRVGERLELDATDNPMPDEDAVAWIPSWLEKLEA